MTSLAEIALEHARQRLAGQPRKAPTSAVPKINIASNHVEKRAVPTSAPVSTGFVAPAPADRFMFLQGRAWAVDMVEAMRSDPAAKVIERLAGATAGKPASYVAGVRSVIKVLQENSHASH